MRSPSWMLTCTLAALLLSVRPARADLIDGDVLIGLNAAGTKVVTGWYNDDNLTRGGPQRVFRGGLEPSTFDGDEPGLRAVDATGLGIPSGMNALPGSTALFLDLLPMTIDARTSNLFYWNGVGPVNFGEAASGTTLQITAPSGFAVTADGTNATISSANPVTLTSATGTIHKHPSYALNSVSTIDDGIYLISYGFRMPGFGDADPAFILFATDAFANNPAFVGAANWVDVNLAGATAVPEPSSLVLGGLSLAAIAAWRRRRNFRRIGLQTCP